MNLDRRWLGTSVRRVRLWTAALTLLGVGIAILGSGARSFQTAAKETGQVAESRLSVRNDSTYQTLGMASPLSASQKAGAAPSSPIQARSVIAGLPLRFEPNQGQANLDPADSRVRFLARGPGYSLLLGSQGAIFRLLSQDISTHGISRPAARIESLEMKLAGANPKMSLTGQNLLPGKSNYLLGNDPAKWRRNVPQFAGVRYTGVYPGIDLVFYGNEGRLEYDFQVAPGSDPAQAELEFDGAQQLELKDGALVIHTKASSVRLEVPRAYQEMGGRRQPVQASFVRRGTNRAGFAIGAYDRSRALVIDPVLIFSTYFGGSGNELASSIAVDGSGNIYLAGSTTSPTLPQGLSTTVFQSTLKTATAQNVYIAKITPPLGTNTAVLDYVTYLGGSGVDYPVGIGVDGAGDAYVAGTTTSNDFPTTLTAYQTKPESTGTHVFVTELNAGPTPPPASELLYSSYLSGNGADIASGMTIDAKGYVYVTGTTTSIETVSTDQFPASNLPQALPFQSIPRYSTQFFVTKVNTNAQSFGSITFSTYFGGGDFVPPLVIAGGGIAVDTNGNIYFTGTTNFTYSGTSPTTDFPILNAYQPCLDQAPPTTIVGTPTCSSTTSTANSDAFVAKLNPNAEQGSQLQWSTYLGGSQTDSGTGIALDSGAANVYVTGTTNSQDFTASTFASFQQCLNNLPPTTTTATTTCTAQPNPAPSDAYVARLSNPANSGTTTPTNVSLTYFSYLGGSNYEQGLAITVDSASGAVLTGWTQSQSDFVLQGSTYVPQPGTFPVFPYPSTIQGKLNGTQDAFLARINTAAATGQNETASWASYFGGTGIGQGTNVTLDVNQIAYFAGNTNALDLLLVKPLQSKNNGNNDAFVAQVGGAATLSIAGVLTLGGNQTYINAGGQATFTYTLTNGGPDLVTNITVTDDLNPAVTGVPLTFVSASVGTISGTCSPPGSTITTVTCSIPSLQSGLTATITIVVTPTPSTSPGEVRFNGGTVIATATNAINEATTSVPAQMSDFSINVSPANVAIAAAGDTATYQVQLTPLPVYNTNISLSVSALPPGATSSFTPPTVTLPSTSPGTTTLNIATTPRPITTTSARQAAPRLYAIWLAFPGLAWLGMGVKGKRRRRWVAGMLLLCALFSLVLLQPACSKTSTQPPVTGTPAGTYTLTVTATGAGTDTRSQTVQLVVP